MTSPKDFNLVAGSGGFRPIDAILQFPFNIRNHSPYVCRKCKGNLKSYIQESTCIIQRSGRNTKKSSAKDKAKIVDELVKDRAFVCQPNRKYNVFKNFKPSLLADFDYHSFCNWIDKHKNNFEKKQKAR